MSERLAFELRNPVQEHLRDYILANRHTRPLIVALERLYAGQSLALCGAGPSLVTHLPEGVDHVWACNSALTYLVERNVRVSAGVGIDQTPGLLAEWKDPPAVPYYVASSCDPALIAHLRSHGRQTVFFHSAVGLEDEFDFYCREWPPTFMVGRGCTVVSRALALARWMGFTRIDVYGADCAFGPDDVTHANGETALEAYNAPLLLRGEIDGREWRTRPDMLMAAVELARIARDSAGSVRLIGDTLPVALLGKSEEFLDQVCRRLEPGEKPAAVA